MAACPITYNWKELPQMLDFCIEKNIALYFNAVFSPAELSLREQPVAYLQEVISFLESNPAPAVKGNLQSPRSLSITAYNDFINLLRGWYAERKIKEAESNIPIQQNANTNVASYLKSGEEINWSLAEIKTSINTLSELETFGYEDKEKNFRAHMANLFAATPNGNVTQVISCYVQWYAEKNKSAVLNNVEEKVKFISGAIEQHPKRKEILAQISQASPAMFTQLLMERDVKDLQSDMQKFFL